MASACELSKTNQQLLSCHHIEHEFLLGKEEASTTLDIAAILRLTNAEQTAAKKTKTKKNKTAVRKSAKYFRSNANITNLGFMWISAKCTHT